MQEWMKRPKAWPLPPISHLGHWSVCTGGSAAHLWQVWKTAEPKHG